MRPRLALLAMAAAGTVACSSKMYIQAIRYPGIDAPPRAETCDIRFLTSSATPDPTCTTIGDVFVGDTGLSIHCDLARVRGDVRSNACIMGGDTVSLRMVRDSISSCAQTRAVVYRCTDAGETR